MPDEKARGNEQWWLMDCAFPDLVWARIRDLENGRAEVLEPGGTRTEFSTRDDAVSYLREDGYTDLVTLQDEPTDDEHERLGRPIAELSAPSAATDEELIGLLIERRSR